MSYTRAVRKVTSPKLPPTGITPFLLRFPNLESVYRPQTSILFKVIRSPIGEIERIDCVLYYLSEVPPQYCDERLVQTLRLRAVPEQYAITVTVPGMDVFAPEDVRHLRRLAEDHDFVFTELGFCESLFNNFGVDADLTYLGNLTPRPNINIIFGEMDGVDHTQSTASRVPSILERARQVFGADRINGIHGVKGNISQVINLMLECSSTLAAMSNIAFEVNAVGDAVIGDIAFTETLAATATRMIDSRYAHTIRLTFFFTMPYTGSLDDLANVWCTETFLTPGWIDKLARACLRVGGQYGSYGIAFQDAATYEPWPTIVGAQPNQGPVQGPLATSNDPVITAFDVKVDEDRWRKADLMTRDLGDRLTGMLREHIDNKLETSRVR